jgi:hypothetical protein
MFGQGCLVKGVWSGLFGQDFKSGIAGFVQQVTFCQFFV